MRNSEILAREISELYLEQSALYERRIELLHWSNPGMTRAQVNTELASLETALGAIREQIQRLTLERDTAAHFELNEYRRPAFGFGSLISRLLGELPSHSVKIDPTKENLRRVRPRTALALATLAGAVALLIGLSITVPWLRISPYLFLYGWLEPATGDWTWAIVTLSCLFANAALTLGFSRAAYTGKLIDRYAMLEEQWFRMGAENWSTGQRIYSCAAFGFMHIVNMIYPVSSLIVLGLVGGVFMTAYLREYARSHSTELATLASTRLHATYNRFGFVYTLTAIGITVFVAATR